MLQEDRFLQIVTYLQGKRSATLDELAKLTSVSVGTVRRDLARMQDSGILSVVRGGAVFRNDDMTKQGFDIRSIKNRDEKHTLTQLLTQVISEGQAVALNSGTTNLEAARFLVSHYRRLTVVTNNLRIIDILRAGDEFTLILPGGVFDAGEHAIIGRQCEDEILTYNVDTALLAVNALSVEKGVTDFRMPEVGIAKAMMKVAKNSVVVADHTKFDRISYMNICNLSELDYILTDEQVTEEQLARYRDQGVCILTPEKGATAI